MKNVLPLPLRLLPVATLLLLGTRGQAQLAVAPQTDLQALAATITGPGVQISNPVITCHSLGYGEYTYSGSGLNLSQGVILTSGRIDDALGPNNSTGSGTWFAQNTPGDPLLDNVTGRTTRDACKFEFDIVPQGDSLRFDFTFASEEYNEWVGSEFNDVFGFFISGPGIVGDPGAGGAKNIALVPGTATAVTINNVNNGSNAAYYHDNTGGSETEYDGYTQDIAAMAVVQPCQSYHLKLIVADATDRKFDSGVFIERIQSPTITMSSFTANGTPDMVEGCNPGWVRFDRGTPRPTPLTLQYYIQGTATNGVDYATIAPVNPLAPKFITIPAGQSYVDKPIDPFNDAVSESTEYLKFILGNPNCPGVDLDTLIFNIVDTLIATATPGGTICLGGSWPITVTGGANYSWSPAAGLSCTTCPDPIASPTTTTNYICTITDGSCARTIGRQVRVSNLTLNAVVTPPLCAGNTNGAINLSLSNGYAPYTYSWTGPGGFTASTEDLTNLAPGTYTVTVTDAACSRTASYNVIAPAPLTVSLAPAILPFGQNISCFGGNTGSIDATISGGTGPYTVSWTGPGGYTSSLTDIASLYAGTYTIQITDAHGCTTNAAATLVQATQVLASLTGTTGVNCYNDNNGTATVSASGGVPPYTYAWSTTPVQTLPTATGLSPGNYTVTVTDGYGCSTIVAATISGPTQMLATTLIAQTNVLCFGNSTGSAGISISGGTAPYSTSWNTSPVQTGTSAASLPAGTWTATVIDANGCTVTRNVTITQPASALSAALFAQTNVNCFGNSTGSATVSASGGTGPYTFQWSTTPVQNTATATNLAAGSYTCTVRDVNNCSTTVNVTITQPAATLSASISAQTNVLCFGNSTGSATVSVSGGTAPYSYSWNSTPVQNTATASNLPAGSYTCTITDANGCSITRNVTITQPAATLSASISAQTNVLCFGNSSGSATVSVSGGTAPYSYSWNSTPVQTTATASNLPAGSYTCTITDANGCSITRNVTITQPAAALSASISAQTNVLCFGNSTGSATVTVSGGTAPYSYSWNSTPVQTTATASNLPAGSYSCTITDASGCSITRNVTITQPVATLSASLSAQTNVLCFGNSTGSATVSVSGGTAPYSYSWNSTPAQNGATATGLIAGSYTCTITDANGCTTAVNVTITQPASTLSASISAQTNVLCFGNSTGSATVSVSGGTAPYSYSWNSTPVQTAATASNLPAGSYTCTITDASGCSITRNVTITQPAATLSASISAQTNVLCFGNSTGSATVSVSGGTAPYSYSWNSTPVQTTATASNLPAGNYTCTITDASGCSITRNVTITQPAATLSASISAQTNVLCFGNSTGSATVSVSGGTAPYSYSWNSTPVQTTATASNLPAGSYTCTITDANGCATAANVIITQPTAALSASISAQTNVLCFGNSTGSATVSVSGGTTPYSYSWNSTPAQTTATASNLPAGSYTCTITDANGCSITRNVTITQPAAALAINGAITPATCGGAATGAVNVTTSGGTGAYVFSWTGPGAFSATTEDISSLGSGVYTLSVTDANGCSANASFNVGQPGLFSVSGVAGTFTGGWNVSCAGGNNGSIDMTVSGGTMPYTHAWTGPGGFTSSALDLTGLPAGAYTYVLTDANGCSVSASFDLTEPTPIVLTTNGVQQITCNGDANASIDVTASGGTAPLAYAWSGPGSYSASTASINNLAPGTYSLVVSDANGCTDGGTNDWTFVDPAVLDPGAGTTANVSCFGASDGSAAATVTGGVAPYSISWNTTPVQTGATATGLTAGTYTVTVTDARGCSRTGNVTIAQPAAVLSASIGAQTNVLCFGNSTGSATVTVGGGTAPYSYSWNSTPAQTSATASNLAAGTYTCTITDAHGCSTSANVTISQPAAALSASLSGSSNVACFGNSTGSATVSVSGGTVPYSYSWNSTPVQTTAAANNLPAGSYSCAITDANGCSTTVNVTIAQPATALSASLISQVNVGCFGNTTGSASVVASGGTPGYSYSWSTIPVQTSATATGLAAGGYSCTITDANGCSTVQNVTITQPAAALGASITAQTNVLIFGQSTGSATVTATNGTAPYTYAWSDGQTTATAIGLAAGSYGATVTDANGCSVVVNVTILQPGSPLSLGLAAQTNVLCFGNNTGEATISAAGGVAPYSYAWNTVPVQTGATASGMIAGTWTCTVTDANGAMASLSVTITQPAAVLTASISSQIDVDCNGNSNGSATVTASGGTPLYSFAWNTSPVQTGATANGLAAGNYTCTVTDANGCTAVQNVTIVEPAAALAATITTQSDVDCFGNADGAATVGASGGTAPYSYSWNTSPAQNSATANNLAAGAWTCTITDAHGCNTTIDAIIAQPAAALGVSIGSVHQATCGTSNGSALATAVGGTAPYGYVWNTVPVQNTADLSGVLAGSYSVTVSDANGCSTTSSVTITSPSGLALALLGTTDQTCYGTTNGQATVLASGGNAPYTYGWNTVPPQTGATASGLVAGTYMATVTDADGCSATLNVTVAGPASPLALGITSVTNVLCYAANTGSATVNATGGLAPYTYSWNTVPPQTGATATGLNSGTYTATVVDAYGCSVSVNVTVTQPVIGIWAYVESYADESCFGANDGWATLEVGGGSGSLSIEWNTVPVQNGATATGLAPGFYLVTITDDNGCDTPKQFPVTISGPSAPVALSYTTSSFNGSAISCPGSSDGSIDLTITGGAGSYTTSWSGPSGYSAATEDISALVAGTYTASVQDANGCAASVSVTLSAPAPLAANAGITTAACQGSNDGAIDLQVSGGFAPYSFLWSGPSAFTANTEDLSGLYAGVYTVTVSDANGCSTPFSFDVTQPGTLSVTGTMSSYPGGWNTSCSGSADGAIDVTGSGGTAPYTYAWSGPSGFTAMTQDLSGLVAGSYDLVMTDANGCSVLASYTLTAPGTLAATVVAQTFAGGGNTSCAGVNDGAIDLTLTGGTPGFVIAWSGPGGYTANTEDINGLAPGTYSMTVWDVNGCSTSGSITLIAAPAIHVNVAVSQYNSGDAIACNGAFDGTLDLDITGGMAPYTVAWTGPNGFTGTAATLTGLEAGTYTAVVADAGGCDTTITVTLTEPSPLTFTATSSSHGAYEVSCATATDGSIDLNVSGGAGNYLYAWTGPNAFVATSQDVSGLEAGTYQVVITDMNGCSITTTFTLTAPQPLSATASIVSVACMGVDDGSIDVTVSGGVAPFGFSWAGPGGFNAAIEDLSNLFAGVYTLNITDANGCTLTSDFDVTQPNSLAVSAQVASYPGGYGVSCSGANDGAIDVSPLGGTAPYYFFWSGPGGFTSITEDLSALQPGTYNLTVTDQNGCSVLGIWTVTSPTPINIGLLATQYAGGANVACTGNMDGGIDAIIVGGVSPYSITWSDANGVIGISEDLTGLAAGTYWIDVTDAVGCSASDSITLIEPTPIAIVPTASTFPSGGGVSCTGATDGSIALSVSGGSLLYFFNWTGPNGFTSNNQNISGLEAGTYTVTVLDANACSASVTLTLDAPTPIAIDLVASQYSGGYAIGCHGDSTGTVDAQISGGSGAYDILWTGPGGSTSTDEDLVNVPAGTYTLVVTDVAGCDATATITLDEPTVIDGSAILSDAGNGYQVGCSGADGAIDLDISGGNAPYTFDWTGTGGFASLDQDLSGLMAGTYAVVVSDANGCMFSAQYTLTQALELNASLTVTGNVCDGLDDGAIDVSVIGGVAPYSFTWTGPGGFNSSDEDLANLAGGEYFVAITDAGGCSTTDSAMIVASAPIDVAAYVSYYNGLNIPCAGDSSGVIGITITGGSAPIDFGWTGPNGYSSNDTYLTGLPEGAYALTITDINGCGFDTTITLTGPSVPLSGSLLAGAYPSGTNISCHGASDGSIDATPIGGVAPYSFDWRGPDSTNFSTEDISGLAAGTYDLVITDANSCTYTVSITLTEPAAPLDGSTVLSAYNGYNVSCNGSADGWVDLSVSGGNGGYLFQWSGPGGFSATTEDVSGIAAGNYTVSVTDTNGCVLALPIEITSPQPVNVILTAFAYPGGTNISCAGMSDGSISPAISGGTAPYAIVWTGPGGFSSTDTAIAGLFAGIYCASVTDTNGCTAQACVELLEPLPLLLTTTPTAAACGSPNGEVDLTIAGGSAPYSFDWSNGADTEDINGLVPDTYSVTVTDLNGCTASTSTAVGGTPGLDVMATLNHELCAGEADGAIDLTVLNGTAPYTYAWSNGDNTQDLSGLSPDVYQVVVTDANGCTWESTFTILAGSNITIDTVVSHYGSHNVSSMGATDGSIGTSVSGGVEPYTYEWSNGAVTGDLTGIGAGTYTLTVTDANGCSAMITVVLTEPSDLRLPTGFSPNGDGQNDTYVVQGLDAYPNNKLVVFNRWGNVVFEQLNYRNQWRGENLMGEPLANGTYFVMVRLMGGRNGETVDIELQDYVDLRR